jgi:hypothetical protein
MKTIFQLKQHLKDFRENKTTFPTYADLAELAENERQTDNLLIEYDIDDCCQVLHDYTSEQVQEVIIEIENNDDLINTILFDALRDTASDLFGDPKEIADNECSLCAGTGIGQYGDPDTSRCFACNGLGVIIEKDD